MTKIYVTGYALSSGIFTADAEINAAGSMATYTHKGYKQYAHGKDFHLTEEEALKDCEERRLKKLKNIEKQRIKLENMKFEIRD